MSSLAPTEPPTPQNTNPPPHPLPVRQRSRRRKTLYVVTALVIFSVALVLVLVVPLSKGSGIGTIYLQSQGYGSADGNSTINITSAGTTTIQWHFTSSADEGGIIVVAGSCIPAQECPSIVSNDRVSPSVVCSSLPSLVEGGQAGANSGACSFHAGAGPFVIYSLVLRGFVAGDEVDYTFSVSGPLL